MPESQPTASLPVEQLAEEWRHVVGWEGLYEVSNLGSVRSLSRVVPMKDKRGRWCTRLSPGKLLSIAGLVDGYPRVNLHRDGKGVGRLVHQLVAWAFLGPPPTDHHEVNHKHSDGDRTRCCVDNLEWVTRSENIKHAREVLGVVVSDYAIRRAREASAKLSESIVRDARECSKRGEPIRSLAKRYGVCESAMRNAVVGVTWRHVA